LTAGGGEELVSGSQLQDKDIDSFCSKDLLEAGENASCKLTVVNKTQTMIYVCWIDYDSGILHHFNPINYFGAIDDGSVSNACTQFTQAGHSFVIFHLPVGFRHCSYLREIPAAWVYCVYRPLKGLGCTYILNVVDFGSIAVQKLEAKEVMMIDQSENFYVHCNAHGFDVYYQKSIDTDSLAVFLTDLEATTTLIRPESRLKMLQESTPIIVNSTLKYGDSNNPEEGRHMCYHPERAWLIEHGLGNDLKTNDIKNVINRSGSIELNNIEDFLLSRCSWGAGGLLVHELSHSYHHKFLPGGYQNTAVHDMYSEAMEQKLYLQCYCKLPDGSKRGPQRAYAASDCMEFFAELSVAYFWQNDNSEFNKWSPYNQAQLRELDPSSFKILQKLWGVG
tara:strand:+ start:99 stop:1274 length:1176 start_codon:yes stop_codon:yes gene_type:complete